MVDSATESCIQSLQRVNEELLKISEKTIFSSSLLQSFSSSVRATWLGEEELVNVFRDCFREHKIDEKVDAVRNLDSASITKQKQNGVVTVEEKLNEKKRFLEKEIGNIKEKQALIESDISVMLNGLDNNLGQLPTIKRSIV